MDRAIKFFPHTLALFHAIGIGLFLYLAKAPELSFLTILGSAVLVLIAEKDRKNAMAVFAVVLFFGYLIELIGVQTGYLFGTYEYEAAMGPLLFGTPVIIGATWYAVVAGSCSIVFNLKTNILFKSLLAGTLAVAMDVLIEQVAVGYGLWQWEGGEIPLYNYICWFIFGTVFSTIYFKLTINPNKTARYLYWIWLAFFAVLAIF